MSQETLTATQAREALQRRLDEEAAGRAEPQWLQERRREAARRFVSEGFPSRKVEAFRFTDLRALESHPLRRPGRGQAPSAPHLPGAVPIVWRNGRFEGAGALPKGVSLRPLAEAADEDPDLRRAFFPEVSAEPPYALLNDALFEEGVLLDVAPRAEVTAPLHLVLETLAEEREVLVTPRFALRLGDGARATVLVESRGAAEGALVVPVENALVGRDARLTLLRLVNEAPRLAHLARTRVRVGRDGALESIALTFGARLHRHDFEVLLEEENAEALAWGLYEAGGDQHVDHHVTIDHVAPHTRSRAHYKAVLGGRARGVFFGKVLVRPGSQKIEADQRNDNLLLTEEALAESTPQLEIYADDVQCHHGSTIGQIEEEPLFYLRTRGIPLAQARELLVYAYAREIVEKVPLQPLVERLEKRLTDVLSGEGGTT